MARCKNKTQEPNARRVPEETRYENCASVILIGGRLSSSVGVVEPDRGNEDEMGVDTPEGSSSTMKRTR